MMNYIGIDLGTTNSVICSYDGVNSPRIWKSPEQNDVTPSAIYIGRRGNRYYGYRAYSRASVDEENVAVLFKRYMGTSNMFSFKDAGVLLSPEECSAEILRVLYGYLAEEIRNDSQTAAVITVPAAFNQVKKEATLKAAHMAGIGKTALMQEPVAAVMSVMKSAGRNSDGVFVVYDLGGGTFDVSIAESIGGKVNLLAQEGKEMCGGRDWDRRIFDSIVVPWLRKNFALPDNFLADEKYRKLRRMTLFAIEQAKIELSQKTPSQEAIIQSDDISCNDLNGKDIYLDIPFSRDSLDPLIDDLLNETIEISRSAMKRAGLNASDIERLVFVGGPTQYGYLREKVSSELAVRTDTGVNPMTAVAEGASIFAESVDWSSANHDRKPRKSDINIGTALSFKYESRVAGIKARVACRLTISAELMFEIISTDTGWTSGRLPLHDGMQTEIPLAKNGDNSFRVVVYDKLGRQIPISEQRITITKTLASVESIPASHSIAVTALDKLGGSEKLVYLVRKDESLPKKGTLTFKAAQTLRARPDSSLNFKLWEGEIETPYDDNRFIGVYKISGSDLETGEMIPAGSEIVCEYEI
ncbi:MAG: Hsp70 family protein [Synergistaceae bacterium]|nr:Hsp70 family protein [Synergistaceae bacterium]